MTLSCYSIPMEKEEENKDMDASPKKKASSTPATPPRSRKRSSVLRFVWAVLFMAGRPSLKKVAPAQVDAVVRSGRTSLWKCLVSGMRPLHHQLEHQGAAPVKALPAPGSLTKADSFHEVFTPATSSLYSSVDSTSTYASAEDLQALDTCEEDGKRDAERDDGDDGGNGEPNEIDVKAEEFIARFYEQQRLESIALHGV